MFVYDSIGVIPFHEVSLVMEQHILEKFVFLDFVQRYQMALPTVMPLPVPVGW